MLTNSIKATGDAKEHDREDSLPVNHAPQNILTQGSSDPMPSQNNPTREPSASVSNPKRNGPRRPHPARTNEPKQDSFFGRVPGKRTYNDVITLNPEKGESFNRVDEYRLYKDIVHQCEDIPKQNIFAEGASLVVKLHHYSSRKP